MLTLFISLFALSTLNSYRLNNVAKSGARWKSLPLRMQVNPQDSGLPEDATIGAIKEAMQEWNTKTKKNIFELEENSNISSSETLEVNGTNAITFSKNFNADSGGFDPYSVVAVGGQFGDGNAMTDAFVLYNAESVKWLVDGVKNYSSVSYSDDLVTITLHELGHVIGLGHSEVSQAVMSTDRGQKIKRTLTQDDIDGALYLTSNSTQASSKSSGARFAGCASIKEVKDANDQITKTQLIPILLIAIIPLFVLVNIRIRYKYKLSS